MPLVSDCPSGVGLVRILILKGFLVGRARFELATNGLKVLYRGVLLC